MLNFFKELVKGIEFSIIGGKVKFHINFTSTSNLLDLFNKFEEEAKKKEEEKAEEKEWQDGKDPSLWEDDDDWD